MFPTNIFHIHVCMYYANHGSGGPPGDITGSYSPLGDITVGWLHPEIIIFNGNLLKNNASGSEKLNQ